MARIRIVIGKKKRLHRIKYHRVRTLSDSCPKQEKYSTSSSCMNYIGAPEWQGDTFRPSQQGYQAKAVNQPPVEVKPAYRKPATDYVSLAIKAAKALNGKTSLDHVEKVAQGLFVFDVNPHLHITMPDMVSQQIFNWIVTLGEQRMVEEEKLKLARKFIAGLTPVSSPAEEPALV